MRIFVSCPETKQKEFEIPFFFYIGLLVIVQIAPMLSNFLGLADTPFYIDVDWEKQNGFLVTFFFGVLLSTLVFWDFMKCKVKASLVSFCIMNALVLTLFVYQAKKHSVFDNQYEPVLLQQMEHASR